MLLCLVISPALVRPPCVRFACPLLAMLGRVVVFVSVRVPPPLCALLSADRTLCAVLSRRINHLSQFYVSARQPSTTI